MDLDRRLTRAGRLLDLAAEGHQPDYPTRSRPPTRPSAKLAAATAVGVLLVVVGVTIAGSLNDDSSEVGTGPAASTPADADFVTLTVTADAEPAEAVVVEVVDPQFVSLPTTGNYQITLTLASPWTDQADVTVGPWESSPPVAVGNQEACSTGQPFCNIDAASLIRHDIGNIVPLFVDASTLPLGDLALQTVISSASGDRVTVTVRLMVSEAEPPPSHTVFTTTTTEP